MSWVKPFVIILQGLDESIVTLSNVSDLITKCSHDTSIKNTQHTHTNMTHTHTHTDDTFFEYQFV